MSEASPITISYVVFCYNQQQYIRMALEAAFAQTYDNLEIVVSDDCSTDNTYKIVEKMCSDYAGPHRIILNRNSDRLGLIGHVNKLFSLATSDYLIVAAGDDYSHPERAEVISKYLTDKPLLLYSDYLPVDENNNIVAFQRPRTDIEKEDLLSIALSNSLLVGATAVWHKDLVALFGEIKRAGAYEDLVFGYRAALLSSVQYIDRKLVFYRINQGISSSGEVGRERSTKNLLAFRDSLEQRLDDTFSLKMENWGIVLRLWLKIKLVESEIDLYRSKKRFFRACLYNPFAQILFCVKVANKLKKALEDE